MWGEEGLENTKTYLLWFPIQATRNYERIPFIDKMHHSV